MDELVFYMSSEEELEIENPRPEAIQRNYLQDHANRLEIPSRTVTKLFRLSKNALIYVLDEIKGTLLCPRKTTAIPPEIKLAAALRFFAKGSYQLAVGEEVVVGLVQQTVSQILDEVATAVEDTLCRKHIRLATSEEEKRRLALYFYEKWRIPSCIGVIDGVHIPMIRSTVGEQRYFNRKQKHSLNVMIIVDSKMMIRSVNPCHGGASHDSHVLSISTERTLLKRNYESGQKYWILGDSAYPLPWLLTPYRLTEASSSEAKYNQVRSEARNIIERTFGVLKARLRCLLTKVAKFVNVCSALHNVCIKHNVELPEVELGRENESQASINMDQFDGDMLACGEPRGNRDRVKNILTNPI